MLTFLIVVFGTICLGWNPLTWGGWAVFLFWLMIVELLLGGADRVVYTMEQPIKEKRLKRDIAAHIGIGQWIALCINNPKYRWGGILLGVFWLSL